MSNYAVINSNTNICDNIIVLDEGSTWAPPADHYIVNIDDGQGGIFWHYDPATQVWTAPPSVTASFDPSPVLTGQTTTLSWDAGTATEVRLSSQGTTPYPAVGSINYSYATAGNKKETIFADWVGGTVSYTCSVRVVVAQAELNDGPVIV